jgi:hypothetical protein
MPTRLDSLLNQVRAATGMDCADFYDPPSHARHLDPLVFTPNHQNRDQDMDIVEASSTGERIKVDLDSVKIVNTGLWM